MEQLNWGCAFDKYQGWIGSDRDDYGQEHVGDILDGLPWDDGTFDVVVSHHALQIVKYVQMPLVFAELYRVLKPGGYFRFSVPDPLRAVKEFHDGNAAWFPVADDVQPTIGGKLTAYLTWYSEARTLFTWDYGIQLLKDAGFSKYGTLVYGLTEFGDESVTLLDKRPDESLFFEALK
jgi:SAM-dependent methyltransferase